MDSMQLAQHRLGIFLALKKGIQDKMGGGSALEAALIKELAQHVGQVKTSAIAADVEKVGEDKNNCLIAILAVNVDETTWCKSLEQSAAVAMSAAAANDLPKVDVIKMAQELRETSEQHRNNENGEAALKAPYHLFFFSAVDRDGRSRFVDIMKQEDGFSLAETCTAAPRLGACVESVYEVAGAGGFHHVHRNYGKYRTDTARSAMEFFAKANSLTQLTDIAETQNQLEARPIWAVIFQKLGSPGSDFSFKESKSFEGQPTEQDREVRREQTIKLPNDVAQLEEANLPRDLATAFAGKEQPVALLWEKAPHIRRAEPWDTEYLIDPEGKCWSEHYPLQVFFRGDCGKVWRLPRNWVGGTFDWLQSRTPQPDSDYQVTVQHVLEESLHLPSFCDLLEINIPRELAIAAAGKPTKVQVRLSPGSPIRVMWSAPTGIQYVIPHTWRRRRVQLPARDRLTEGGVPDDIAAIYAGRVVSVNYHPGSMCCLLEHYRFRDEQGNRWPVKIKDCFLVGYGDADEHSA